MVRTRLRAAATVVAAVAMLVGCAVPSPAPTPTDAFPPLPEPTFVDPPTEPSSVFIPRAEWDDEARVLRVWAFVTALSEEGGTCTLHAGAGAETAEVAVPATADASTTVCDELDIESPEAGTWTLTVDYASPTTSATSEPVEVVVS
ncbi:hypothetical protein [Protaetiibacter intestinalis]|uniref:Uncharacterized protein n=1 Tax=Protaetiibacter intestinalis TaxID=2419774 RepID=A0A387BB40_9MICO|nr:hypothetical protein [Protaetiibacter intestinalis]AYF98335.1 hypothetical protein D7I47_08750 [Protaetiibacter intestinalis]